MGDITFQAVSVIDPAIDTERMTYEQMTQYVQTRDLALLQGFFKPGKSPMRFTLREVPHGLWESYVCLAPEDSEQRRLRAFQCGVVSVQNLAQADETTVSEWAPSVRAGEVTIMSDAEAFKRFVPAVRAEIGQVVLERSFLGWWTAPTYRLPRSLVERCLRRPFLPADANQNDVAPSSAKPSSGTAAEASTPTATGT